MKISSINNSQQSFGSIYNNKAVLKGLEKISEHGASFVAGTSLAMAAVVKPFSIALTPDVKKENKEHAIANSITSGLVKFAIFEAIALPVENAIKKIDKNPKDYLNKETIKNLKSNAKNLPQSKDYRFATQFLKLGTGLVTAIPKSVISVALLPFAMNILFGKKSEKEPKKSNFKLHEEDNIFTRSFNKNPSFKGSVTDITAKGISKILNNTSVQNAVKKYSSGQDNLARNIAIATDSLLALSFAHRTVKSKKIKEERKKPLVFNNLISTNFIEKFTKENKGNPKLGKYIEGINIVRPTLIFAGIYYGVLPFISTFMAERLSEKQTKQKK